MATHPSAATHFALHTPRLIEVQYVISGPYMVGDRLGRVLAAELISASVA